MTELAETSQSQQAKGKTQSQIPASSNSVKTEAHEKKGKEKEKANQKEKVKLIIPSLQPTEARGSMRSFQESNGAAYAGRKGTRPNQPMLSLEHQSQASTQPAYSSPVFIAQLDSFEKASSTAETLGILVDTGAATSVAPKSFASDVELSPAPSTLQLTTATGKAVRTYGLKTVYLQSQGLSLGVTFVIADVVTPLLGLDSMIKDRLSLHVEHDFQHFLVNPAGDRTQLEHMGRYLYFIACPSQHGLSQCFPGSLSQVIGTRNYISDLLQALILMKTQASNKLSKTA